VQPVGNNNPPEEKGFIEKYADPRPVYTWALVTITGVGILVGMMASGTMLSGSDTAIALASLGGASLALLVATKLHLGHSNPFKEPEDGEPDQHKTARKVYRALLVALVGAGVILVTSHVASFSQGEYLQTLGIYGGIGLALALPVLGMMKYKGMSLNPFHEPAAGEVEAHPTIRKVYRYACLSVLALGLAYLAPYIGNNLGKSMYTSGTPLAMMPLGLAAGLLGTGGSFLTRYIVGKDQDLSGVANGCRIIAPLVGLGFVAMLWVGVANGHSMSHVNLASPMLIPAEAVSAAVVLLAPALFQALSVWARSRVQRQNREEAVELRHMQEEQRVQVEQDRDERSWWQRVFGRRGIAAPQRHRARQLSWYEEGYPELVG